MINRPVFLLGLPATGKSIIGKKLAYYMRYGFLDLDATIESKARCSISEIFKKQGESAFRKMEAEVVFSLANVSGFVVAVGAGATENQDIGDFLNQNGTTVYLESSPRLLAKRLYMNPESLQTRPLLSSLSEIENHEERLIALEKKIDELLMRRHKSYEMAQVRIRADYDSMDTIAYGIQKEIVLLMKK